MNAAKTTTRRQYRIGKKRLPSVTTILDQAAKPALLGWAAGCGARAVARMLTEGLSVDDALARVRIEWQKERKAAADAGTRAHGLLEAWAKDEPADADLTNELDAAAHRLCQTGIAHLQATGSRVVASEVGLSGKRVGGDEMAFGGTFDLVIEREGALWLADWKTGAGVYGDSVIPQLAAYCELWRWLDLGWAQPVDPDADLSGISGQSGRLGGALVLHLPYEGPITEHAVTLEQLGAGWQWFTHCFALWALKKTLTLDTETKTEKENTDD